MINTDASPRPLKVLVAHNAYKQRGGEDAVVEAEIALLRKHGHDVVEHRCSNDGLDAQARIRSLADTLWSRSAHALMHEVIRRHQPDVMHVHNTFPRLSPSIYWAAHSERVPVVQTLHNFRLACAQATFLRNGQVCEACLHTLPWRGVVQRCYRGSLTQSSALVGMLALHRALGTFRSKVTRYIALSEFSKKKFVAAGLPADKLSVKPNFVGASDPSPAARQGGLFVGRLSEEKGIRVLLDALSLSTTSRCTVIGSGPLERIVAAHPQVRWLGWQDQNVVREHMGAASYVVLPSIGYEQFPLVIAEAYACGTPVVASRLGALEELVHDGQNGLLFAPGDAAALAEKLAFVANHPDRMRQMGDNARAHYELKYTPERNYEQLIAIYTLALSQQRMEKANY